MLQPELYAKVNSLQRQDSQIFLGKHLTSLINWIHDGNDALLDIGVGSGDVTMDFIYPLLPKTMKKLVGVDISEKMVQFCKKKYESEKVKFHQMDIGKDIFEDLEDQSYVNDISREGFNVVVSFYTLHFVKDQE